MYHYSNLYEKGIRRILQRGLSTVFNKNSLILNHTISYKPTIVFIIESALWVLIFGLIVYFVIILWQNTTLVNYYNELLKNIN